MLKTPQFKKTGASSATVIQIYVSIHLFCGVPVIKHFKGTVPSPCFSVFILLSLSIKKKQSYQGWKPDSERAVIRA